MLIIGLGVGASFWLLHFTSFLPEALPLLGLGGIFTWLEVVSKTLPRLRLEELQSSFESSVLMRRSTSVVVFCLIAAGVVFGTSVGGVRIESLVDAAGHSVRLNESEPEQVGPQTEVREPFVTGFFSSRLIKVKVGGYPEKLVKITPWRVSRLYVPESFVRPVILLRPTLKLTQLASNPLQIVVSVAGKEYSRRFDGRSIWVGCDSDVSVPMWLQERWKSDKDTAPQLAIDWAHPETLHPSIALEKDQVIDVRVVTEGIVLFSRKIVVQAVLRMDDFPQEEILDAQ